MSDPRNVAHDKKVKQEKENEPAAAHKADKPDETKDPAPATPPEAAVVEHEKSVAVLSKLKEMEFHSRANIETLAELSLTVEDELKQKEFAGPVGELYSAQDQFQTKITALIHDYEAFVEKTKPA
ncbi:MAG: hypothetical protein M3429_01410 [Verrucomicrobiota bacterium]|jgi:hypothetical protein|nr:hypothetical protein [Chthoniobacterales bacterium]MDQ3116313.1 hypothetical protein [Verrucomicrobiota bacterium]MDQ3545169.1 hypothetical protein [Verrucomicrobiota bacterium]